MKFSGVSICNSIVFLYEMNCCLYKKFSGVSGFMYTPFQVNKNNWYVRNCSCTETGAMADA